MRFYRIPQALRLLAVAIFSILLVSCGQGEGPDEVVDPLFAECKGCPIGGPGPGPGGGELLTNGDLEGGQAPWINQAVVVDDAGNNVLQGVVTAPDPGQPFLVNASQVLDITAGETYTLTFRARATVSRNIIAGIGLNVGPFTNVVETVPLTTDWQAYTYVLTANGFGGADSRVLFDMNGEAGDVFIDDVSLTAGSLLTNGDVEAGQAPWINQAVVFDDGGNNVLQGVVTAPDPGQPFLVNASQVLDITAGETYVLTFKARGAVDRSMIAGIGLNVGPFTNNVETVALSTAYQTFTCTLTAAGFGGADSRVLFDMNAEAGDVFIDDIALALLGPTGIPTVDGCAGGGGGGGGGGGQLLTNGDFEAGDLSGWSPADNGGAITADDTQDSGSTWSVHMVAGPLNNPALSQVNLAVGTVATGDPIDVSFDMCGSLVDGAVVIPAVLSEFGIGIGADRQDLDNFANIPSVWTRYNYQGIAGANVAGGVSVQLDVICGGAGTCAGDVYFDNVSATIGGGMVAGTASGNSCVGGGGGGPTEPVAAAPTPTLDPLDVIAVFSDAYPVVLGPGAVDYNPNWGQGTVVTTEMIAGNDTLKYAGLDYQGTDFGGAQDLTAAGMTHLHVDFWTADSTALNVYVIGAGEFPVALTPDLGNWVSVDIPLTDFTGVDMSQAIQFKFDGNGTIFIDNLYFSCTGCGGGNAFPTEPVAAAPTPTRDPMDVIAVFSDAYPVVLGPGMVDYNPNWGQGTVVTTEMIAGNDTLKYAGLDYQGTDFGGPQDLTAAGMTHLHVDFWTVDSTALNVYVIGAGESPVALTPSFGNWVSVDIPLTDFTGVDMSQAIQFKFDGNGTIFIDNLYFYGGGGGGGGGGPSGTATIDFEPGGFGAGFTWETFENDDNPALQVIANPVSGTGNTSATVGAFTARVTGQPYAGFQSAHGDVGPYIIDASTRYVKIWVYKSVISDVGIKLVVENDAALPEVKVANTQINQWEQLTFDFNSFIGFGEYATMNIDRLVVFPDFDARAGETLSYIDNISFEATP